MIFLTIGDIREYLQDPRVRKAILADPYVLGILVSIDTFLLGHKEAVLPKVVVELMLELVEYIGNVEHVMEHVPMVLVHSNPYPQVVSLFPKKKPNLKIV